MKEAYRVGLSEIRRKITLGEDETAKTRTADPKEQTFNAALGSTPYILWSKFS